jgi:hypothetical protein
MESHFTTYCSVVVQKVYVQVLLKKEKEEGEH